MRAPKVPLAALNAGTGIELPNVDAMLLLAMCDKGWGNDGLSVSARNDGPIPAAARHMAAQGGDIIIGGRVLPPKAVEALLAKRLKDLEDNMLDKLLEIGVVSVEG